MNPYLRDTLDIWQNGYKPKCVRLNEDKLNALAAELARKNIKIPNWRLPVYWPYDNENFLQFLGVTTAVNACYYNTGLHKKFACEWNGRWEGSFGMMASVMRCLKSYEYNLLSPGVLTSLDVRDLDRLFAGYPPMPIPHLRRDAWREVGQNLLKLYGGKFINLFEAAGWRCFDKGNGIVERLVRDFPLAYGDSRVIDGREIVFAKKAQLLPLMYQGRALDSSGVLPLIRDIKALDSAMDYQVPRTLEHFGVLEYSPGLRSRIEDEQPLPESSLGEIEIRLVGRVAVFLLRARINEIKCKSKKKKITLLEEDYLLWSQSRGLPNKHHICMTLNY